MKTIIDDPVYLQVRPGPAVFLNPRLLRPLPQSMWGACCSRCDRHQSVWEFFAPDLPANSRKGQPVCSLCWLYESEWGKGLRSGIDALVRAVEDRKRQTFHKADDGRLWACRDADRILGSITVISRIVWCREMMSVRGEADGM